MKVYLSGPISGSSASEVEEWRQTASSLLPQMVEILDPAMAPYEAELAYTAMEGPAEALARLRHGLLVVERNKHLIQSADVVLINLLATERASIGSVGEAFWANAFRVPVIIVRDQHGSVHDHAMLNAIASVVTHTLEDGCQAVINMLRTQARVGRPR